MYSARHTPPLSLHYAPMMIAHSAQPLTAHRSELTPMTSMSGSSISNQHHPQSTPSDTSPPSPRRGCDTFPESRHSNTGGHRLPPGRPLVPQQAVPHVLDDGAHQVPCNASHPPRFARRCRSRSSTRCSSVYSKFLTTSVITNLVHDATAIQSSWLVECHLVFPYGLRGIVSVLT